MDNQHRKISGYRELSQTEIDLMNKIKALGPQIQSVVEKIKAHVGEQRLAADSNSEEMGRLDAADPEMWVGWGAGSAQLALMQLTRAVAQPTFF